MGPSLPPSEPLPKSDTVNAILHGDQILSLKEIQVGLISGYSIHSDPDSWIFDPSCISDQLKHSQEIEN